LSYAPTVGNVTGWTICDCNISPTPGHRADWRG